MAGGSLSDMVEAQWAAGKGRRLPAHDVVGDIAIVTLTPGQEQYEQEIGAAILASNRRIKVVAARAGHYHGEFRTVALRILAGEKRLETEVKEFGVRLLLHVEDVYFSVRSGRERRRIAALVRPGEDVLVLFSGVAPFPLVINKYARPKLIVGVEKNPVAHRYAMDNLKRNGNSTNIVLHCGDAGEILKRLELRFDRVLMPLPTLGEHFLRGALSVLKPGGWLHYYDMREKNRFDDSPAMLAEVCSDLSRQLVSAQIHRCGHCSPKAYRICVDARII